MPSIVFTEPWGRRSWKVNFVDATTKYENDRPPHVEVGEENMHLHTSGETHELTNLHLVGRSIMWNVEGVSNSNNQNNGCSAHFTVYFGDDAKRRFAAGEFN